MLQWCRAAWMPCCTDAIGAIGASDASDAGPTAPADAAGTQPAHGHTLCCGERERLARINPLPA